MNMPLKQYERVRLRTDRFVSDGAKKGDVGFVIEIYPDGNVEVEFSNADGVSYAQLVATPEDLESVDDEE